MQPEMLKELIEKVSLNIAGLPAAVKNWKNSPDFQDTTLCPKLCSR